MSRIGVLLGTRPELIKCLPLLKSSSMYIPIFVEQHKDLVTAEYTSAKYTIPVCEYGDSRLDNIISSILNAKLWKEAEFDAIIVQGDTAVAFASAVAAFHRGIKVIHLEAGLRTYNNEHPWPEEGYRRMIDTIASVALCPSEDSANNLRREKFSGDICVVGNTSIDAIRQYGLVASMGSEIVVTLHRRENLHQIKGFFEAIEELAIKYPQYKFILPIHPNPEIRAHAEVLTHVNVVEPMNHREMCELLARCNCIISDSGGIQEEAGWLGKHVFCCRLVTERIELYPTYLTFTSSPKELLERFKPQEELLPSAKIYGDGDTVENINRYLHAQ
jgi:UDP-N-acetylglucosamine 2-epimerase (non-hydrolysing)